MKAMNAVAVVVGALVAAPGLAEKPPTPASKDAMICRVETITGTRFKRRVCASAADWALRDQISKEARDNIDKIQQHRALDGSG